MLCEEEQEPKPQKGVGGSKQVDDKDIFVGVNK